MQVTAKTLTAEARQTLGDAMAVRDGKTITACLKLLRQLGNDKPTEQDNEAISLLAELDAIPTALYRHYDVHGALLYIGVSMTITGRTARHETYAPWFREIDHIKLDWYGSRSSALRAEEQAIKAEKPLHNIIFNKSRKDRRARSQEPTTGTLLPTGKAGCSQVPCLPRGRLQRQQRRTLPAGR